MCLFSVLVSITIGRAVIFFRRLQQVELFWIYQKSKAIGRPTKNRPDLNFHQSLRPTSTFESKTLPGRQILRDFSRPPPTPASNSSANLRFMNYVVYGQMIPQSNAQKSAGGIRNSPPRTSLPGPMDSISFSWGGRGGRGDAGGCRPPPPPRKATTNAQKNKSIKEQH